jgi:DNA-binding transcriptional LysR family regulator
LIAEVAPNNTQLLDLAECFVLLAAHSAPSRDETDGLFHDSPHRQPVCQAAARAFAGGGLRASALPNAFAVIVRFTKAGTNASTKRFSRPERPTGRVRLLVTPLSATMVLAPKLVPFARRFPDIVLDVTTTQEGRTELVATGFDAGIHLGESIQRDMVAVRVSRDQRLAVVGSPDYFASHPKPSSPHDLPNHRCINLCGGSAGPYRWEFEKGGEALVVDVSGPLIDDDADLMIRAAVDGLGLTFSFEECVPSQIASGALVRVLEDWCPPFASYFLYYPSRRQQPAALSALIDTLRLEDGRK